MTGISILFAVAAATYAAPAVAPVEVSVPANSATVAVAVPVPATPAATPVAVSVPATPAAIPVVASVPATPAAIPVAASVPATPAAIPVAASVPATPAVDAAVAAAAPRAPCADAVRLDRKSRSLQRNLEGALRGARLSRHVARHRLAVAVVDLTRADEIYYAGVNDDDMLYAASLPKIAILLAVAQTAADGRLTWTAEHDVRMASMINDSSNVDATWAAELVGFRGIETVMRDPRYCLYDDVHGGLWVGRPYAPNGETYRDPVGGQSHGATARQAARFYTLLASRKLVSKTWSDRMLGVMSPPRHQHKFVRGLAERSAATFLARKSGTWRNWHSDSALIQHDDKRYVAVALTELRTGEDVLQHVIRVVDDLVMQGKHRRPRREPHA